MSQILDNLNRIRQRVHDAALRVGRDPQDVQILAVTKTVPIAPIREVVAAGMDMFGENRVQELKAKIPQFSDRVQWHMIGSLQTNKLKLIGDKVALIHSLDRLALAEAIDEYGQRIGRPLACLVEVNVAGERTKHGLCLQDVTEFIQRVSQMRGIMVDGFMTMAPYCENAEEVRPVFRELRRLASEIAVMELPRVTMRHLSMGMSNDFEVAIEEGATLVRIGSAIFGSRD